jgi:DnaJ-class molecular chaperone
MDLSKLQQMAKEIAEQVPEGENKSVGEMDMNKMFQHTTQMVFKMMNEGKLNELGINPEAMGQGVNPSASSNVPTTIEEVETDEDDDDDEPGILPKTKNLNCDLNVSLKDLYVGKRKKIHVKRKVYENGKQTTSKKKFIVPIHPGMHDDEIVKFTGESDQKPGHRPGDIVIRLCEEPHPYFERDGDNLLYTMDISFSEAFNLKTEIEHLDGKLYYIDCNDPIHTNNGVRKLEGLGMPIYDETNETDLKYGDLYIKFSLKVPECIEDEENKESHIKSLRKMFPPLNKIYDKEKCKRVVLKQLTEDEFNSLYQYEFDDEDDEDDDEDDEDDDEDDEDEDDDEDDDEFEDEEFEDSE